MVVWACGSPHGALLLFGRGLRISSYHLLCYRECRSVPYLDLLVFGDQHISLRLLGVEACRGSSGRAANVLCSLVASLLGLA